MTAAYSQLAAHFGKIAALSNAVGILQWPLVPVVLCLAPASILLAWIRARSDA